MQLPSADDRQKQLVELKHHVDNANLSTVCDKRELETPFTRRPELTWFMQQVWLWGLVEGTWLAIPRQPIKKGFRQFFTSNGSTGR